MFVGHEFLAFALAGTLTRLTGRDARTALFAGGVAALCALLPDLDVAYGFATYLLAVADGTTLSWDAFWGVTNGVHRVVTHPLPVGAAATLCFAAAVAIVPARGRGKETRMQNRTPHGLLIHTTLAVVASVVAAAVIWAMARVSSESAAVVAATYLGTVCVVGAAVSRRFGKESRLGIGTPTLAFAAGVGFLTHPFGDVLMAAPPPLFAPAAPSPLTDRVVFSADETVNLLNILFVEVATVWAGLFTYLRLTGHRLRDAFAGRAVVGVGYAAAAFVLPRPTMVDAHYLGFTVVPLAVVVGATAFGRGATSRRMRAVRALTIGLATLTIAAVAYLVAYLLI
ncbi:membrane-bound metal-dependent hydrolase (duf457) [Halogeometricum borinquense DSM 11551]|uniref:Membrane-bound metal-dependent hydrolase (Duf457) n=1 Tax=Halogeometricum borinquense (strain ATCC 700274 / DSM 11551 / JCM 10706 / KCTC 4070 / PR3) TaxID=469382 RepID=E4NMP0_HALBP|nr:metal-dependent hydrolase [Halogeometricum borinquense]ADQ66195.1 Predicted membrane-bound metal-dependent hydrolase (DUF457) [Halogeometricum borinquense DSM 11551]ELY27310.1 membrane-bound metal-dependent hydrolase (duf457) [Halogeometricum borinquense DSM 11551]